MVYVIRKSWLDEETEFGRCNDKDVAISICPSGYIVYDEDSNIIHTTVSEDKYKYGKSWAELKTTIEREIINFKESRFMKYFFPNSIKKYMNILSDILVLMNKIEVEDSKDEKLPKMVE